MKNPEQDLIREKYGLTGETVKGKTIDLIVNFYETMEKRYEKVLLKKFSVNGEEKTVQEFLIDSIDYQPTFKTVADISGKNSIPDIVPYPDIEPYFPSLRQLSTNESLNSVIYLQDDVYALYPEGKEIDEYFLKTVISSVEKSLSVLDQLAIIFNMKYSIAIQMYDDLRLCMNISNTFCPTAHQIIMHDNLPTDLIKEKYGLPMETDKDKATSLISSFYQIMEKRYEEDLHKKFICHPVKIKTVQEFLIDSIDYHFAWFEFSEEEGCRGLFNPYYIIPSLRQLSKVESMEDIKKASSGYDMMRGMLFDHRFAKDEYKCFDFEEAWSFLFEKSVMFLEYLFFFLKNKNNPPFPDIQ